MRPPLSLGTIATNEIFANPSSRTRGSWQATSETDPDLVLLPRMQTDISATRPGEYRIIDAKFYRQTLGNFFDSEKIHSANLYQMTSYLMNAPAAGGREAKGMLIYPKVDRV